MIDLNDGNWEVVAPKPKVNLDDLDGPTDEELDAIENEEDIAGMLEELEYDAFLWNLNV